MLKNIFFLLFSLKQHKKFLLGSTMENKSFNEGIIWLMKISSCV